MKKRSVWFLSVICLLLLAACEKEPQAVKVTGISVNPTSLSLVEGETGSLTATVSPSDADDKTVIWDSSDKSVASVENGKVTALKAGSANITVKSVDGGFTASCSVSVSAKTVDVASISLSKEELTLKEGDSETITATVKPDDATDKTVTWTSSDPSVATVDGGKIEAVKEGTATVTAKAGDKTATCKVTVDKKVIAVESVELDKTEVELTEGDSVTLTATVKPDDATDKTVTWTSSDPSVATVDGGKIEAVKEGSATITAKSGEKSATCQVTVKKKVIAVELVELDKTEVELTEGDSVTLIATVKPDDATDKTVTWTSSDPAVATVDGGKIEAVKEGTATITAKSGEKSATCQVTVKKVIAVESVELDKTEVELTEGDSVTLTATVKPDDATDKTVTWTSSDPAVATVDGGKIEAVKEGTATITAKSGEKSAACTVIVKAKVPEHPLAALFGDYTFTSPIVAFDEERENLVYTYASWEMAISPYEGSKSRIWIDKIVPLFSEGIGAEFFPHGEVCAEVSIDMKTITIDVPQQVEATASFWQIEEPLILYKCAGDDADAEFETFSGTITFTLQEDGSWRTTDSYGFSTESEVKNGFFYPYMNCYGGLSYDYPTYFVKNGTSTQGSMSPSRRMSSGKVSKTVRANGLRRVLGKIHLGF